MSKAKKFYDFMTGFVIFFTSLAVTKLLTSKAAGSQGSMGIVVLAALVVLIYSFMIIVLGIRKSTKFSHGLFVVLGSVFVPVVLPVLYYLTYLRALMDEKSFREKYLQLLKKTPQAAPAK